MDKPRPVTQSIYLIWITLAISAITALADKWTGYSSEGEFMFTLIFYGLLCIFPYKLSNKSNPTRYVYTVLTGITLLFLLGGIEQTVSELTYIASILILPVNLFAVYLLFQPKSNEWFTSSANVSPRS